jgi:hypothetical protein
VNKSAFIEKMVEYYTESRRKGITSVKEKEGQDWIDHTVLWKCLLKDILEGKIEMIGRCGRRRK